MLLKFDDKQIRDLFGSEDAENESLTRFHEYFIKNKAYENLTADLPLRIVVGHKGVGKSALLRYSYEEDIESGILSVFLKPDDLSELLKVSREADINSLIDAWKIGIRRCVTEKAVEFITDGYEDKFDQNIIQQGARKLTSILKDALKVLKPEYVNAANNVIYNNFIKNNRINIYIDDIDRGWSAREEDILNISALINALKDISAKDDGIRCKIAIRTDVYYLVRTSDESTDKIEQDIIRLMWSNDDILRLMAFRISTYFKMGISWESIQKYRQKDIATNILSKVMDPNFQGRGKWSNESVHRILMSLCRKRPRDLVKLLHGAARQAATRGGDKILTYDFIKSFPLYSEERLQDLFNEFKSEAPEISRFVMQFKQTRAEKFKKEAFKYANDAIIAKIKNIKQSVPFSFTSKRIITEKAILSFLYKIDFIIARIEKIERPEWRYFDQSRFLAHEHVDFGNNWEIHPAYRWALEPTNIDEVIDSVSDISEAS